MVLYTAALNQAADIQALCSVYSAMTCQSSNEQSILLLVVCTAHVCMLTSERLARLQFEQHPVKDMHALVHQPNSLSC